MDQNELEYAITTEVDLIYDIYHKLTHKFKIHEIDIEDKLVSLTLAIYSTTQMSRMQENTQELNELDNHPCVQKTANEKIFVIDETHLAKEP